MTDKDIEKLLQRMAKLIERASSETTFADESESGFDIYNHRGADGKYNLPQVTMFAYLTRFNKFIALQYDDQDLSIKILILAMTFIDQFVQKNPGFQLTDLNRHHLLCVAALEANKVLVDQGLNNEFFTRLGGLINKELINQLEIDFFKKMKFNFTIDKEKFAAKAKSLGLTQPQIDEILAVDENGMSPRDIMEVIPEQLLPIITPNSTPSNSTPSNSTPSNDDYKKPQNKTIGWMSNLFPCFGYKKSKDKDSQSQSTRSTSSSSSTKPKILTKVSPKCYSR